MVAYRLSNHGSSYWLPGRLSFLYDFKTNRMLLTARSFCFFEINTWPLPPKNFTILSQKMKRLDSVKLLKLIVNIRLGFCSEFTKITVFFLQNYRTKLHSWTGQIVCHMFKIIWSVSSRWFGACK